MPLKYTSTRSSMEQLGVTFLGTYELGSFTIRCEYSKYCLPKKGVFIWLLNSPESGAEVHGLILRAELRAEEFQEAAQ